MAFWKPGNVLPPSSSTAPSSSSLRLTAGPQAPPAAPAQLSKNVMNMKFMKRKEEADVQNKEEANKRRKLLDSQQQQQQQSTMQEAVNSQPRTGNLICTIETTDLYSTLPGRRSFGGFNKVVERYYASSMDLQSDLVGNTHEVSAKEEAAILKQYESLVSLPRGPNQGAAPKHLAKKQKQK